MLAVVIQGRQATEMYVVLNGRLQVWEHTGMGKCLSDPQCSSDKFCAVRNTCTLSILAEKALTRVRCAVNGVEFWSTVYLGFDEDERNLEINTLGDDDQMDDEEDERRMESRKRSRRKALSLDNPTVHLYTAAEDSCLPAATYFGYHTKLTQCVDTQVREIQELQRDASLLSSEGHKMLQANDFSCVSIFQEALQKIDTALIKIEEMAGQNSDLAEVLVATQVDTVKLQEQLNARLQQAMQAKCSFSELSKLDRTERERNPTGAVDLRGREKDPALAHRSLSMGSTSIVQGVVRVSNPTLYLDFDPALGLLTKMPKLRMHQVVDALE